MSVNKFQKYDHLLTGILMALLLPIFWYLILMSVYSSMETMGWMEKGAVAIDFRQRTSALAAICLNILPLQIFKNHYMDRAMRGVVFPTVAYVGLWLYQFGSSVL